MLQKNAADIITIDFDDIALQDCSCEELALRFEGCGEISIRIPLPSVNNSNSHIDVVCDYLDASYALEVLAQSHPDCSLKQEWERNYFPYYILTVNYFNNFLLADSVLRLIWTFQYPEDASKESEYLSHREMVNEYEETLTSRLLKFPEVVESYFANLINGAYFELEYDVIREQVISHPERSYGFWASAYYNKKCPKVFVSTEAWIIPREMEIENVFKEFDYEGECSLLNSKLLIVEGRVFAISEGTALEFPIESLMRALSCAEYVSYQSEEYELKFSWANSSLFSLTNNTGTQQSASFYDDNNDSSKIVCFVSEYSDYVVINAGNTRCVIFSVSSLKNHEILKISQSASEITSSILDEVQSPSDIAIPWLSLNDETFEQLCYDIIYHNSKYDRQTIRKMGKSRSRDGGRDIVVHTKARPGEQAKKYIFQCKLYNPDTSANTSNVKSVSDVIDQYGADGYGLMCSCYIDSTLYDKLDGIAQHRSIQIETWSKFEIERYVARRPTLRARFLSS